jgi:hypothetical protein
MAELSGKAVFVELEGTYAGLSTSDRQGKKGGQLRYIGLDGYPLLRPAFQTQSLDQQCLLFSTSVYMDELNAIPAGIPLAVFSMALTMEDVLLRGTYLGLRRVGGIKSGLVQVNWIYNPMPPVAGQVYPPSELQPVESFNSSRFLFANSSLLWKKRVGLGGNPSIHD